VTDHKKKLIEVALPLDAISAASRKDKDRKTGTIKNVHKWFAPMPTPAWRALLFAALIDDPGDGEERARLLHLIGRLVDTDGGPSQPEVLETARALLHASGPLPTVLDPFCGAGSTIVEAQRLGLPAVGSDLNPVPVLITKLLCELVPAVAGRPPLSPLASLEGIGGPIDGFAADIRYYAERVRDAAWTKVGYLYPPVPTGTVVAWLWARTVPCPNPACRATVPLYSSPWLSKRKGEERWLKPVIHEKEVRFEIGEGRATPPSATKLGRGANFRCPVCLETVPEAHVKNVGSTAGLGVQLLAIVVDQQGGGRTYRIANETHVQIANVHRPENAPDDLELPDYARWFSSPAFGMATQADLYTNRQLHTLTTFADAVADVTGSVKADGGDDEYASAITTALGLCLGKLAQSNSAQVRWNARSTGSSKAEPAFSRQALPMVWDYTEVNPFGASVGSWLGQVESLITGVRALPPGAPPAHIVQSDARVADTLVKRGSALIATDPPYFGQIGYADLADYFYVWHRRALRSVHPELFSTIETPKDDELIAIPYRHNGDMDAAYRYFMAGFTEAFAKLVTASRADLPILVVYAHRQEETEDEGLTSSAWDAMLEAVLAAGLGVVGTWPIHGTRDARMISIGTNALASYVVMVCRPRPDGAAVTDRQGFLRALRAELPEPLRALQEASTLPFDLTQAAIGPGMAIFSRFARVLEPAGEPMRVRTALSLINQVRIQVLSEQDDEFDAATRWAVQWFERYRFDEGPFGEAEKLFTATATSLDGLRRDGIVATRAPKVWLIEPSELPDSWDPITDARIPVWEATMHLLRTLDQGGEQAAAALLTRVGDLGDLARDLAYRLADICERNRWSKLALAVNALVASWPEIARLAGTQPAGEMPTQQTLM
jgi:putative DNA methylase